MTRRLRAKPEALAARQLANGTQPGTMTNGVAVAMRQPETGQLKQDLETSDAALDRALVLLEGLERLVTKVGGFMRDEDQQTLREARAFLVERGRRVLEDRPTWIDRE